MNSKTALDRIINKSRVHLYKPIQIAEILYHHRTEGGIQPSDIESYRNISKRWRDDISLRLVGRKSTSSQKFQDNLFESNAMPPKLLDELSKFNKKHKGAAEAYIYYKLKERLDLIFNLFQHLKKSTPDSFTLKEFLSMFVETSGLRRSVDKAYEIVVYALFSAIVRELRVEINMSIKNTNKELMKDFEPFIQKVLGMSKNKKSVTIPAQLYRVGVANAADRGLDMLANFGSAIQVKHITLSEEIAEEAAGEILSDKIVLVCLDAEKETIRKITKQLDIGKRIHSIITSSDLEEWYVLCLSRKYREKLGKNLLKDLQREFAFEFPTISEIGDFIKDRGYDKISLEGEWKV